MTNPFPSITETNDCPFCGFYEGTGLIQIPYIFKCSDSDEDEYYGECPNCFSRGPIAQTKEEAHELWRTRKVYEHG